MSDEPPTLADIVAALARIEMGQIKLQADIMARIDRLQDAITAIRDDVGVNMGAVDVARQVADTIREDVKLMREQVSVMYWRMLKAEADIRVLKGDAS
jgi:hypothetical protein